MTGDKDVSSLVLTTTPQQEVVQLLRFHHVSSARCNLAVFWSLWNSSFLIGVISLRCQVLNTIVQLGLRRNQSQLHLLSPTQQRTPRTVLITESGMKSTNVFHSSTVCSNLNRSVKVTSFRQCTQCPSPSVGVFVEWAAFAVEHVKGYALLDTGASRSVGGYMMVQNVIDCLTRNTAPPWLESANPAVSFTFAGGETAQSETRIWLPLPGTRHGAFCNAHRSQ